MEEDIPAAEVDIQAAEEADLPVAVVVVAATVSDDIMRPQDFLRSFVRSASGKGEEI